MLFQVEKLHDPNIANTPVALSPNNGQQHSKSFFIFTCKHCYSGERWIFYAHISLGWLMHLHCCWSWCIQCIWKIINTFTFAQNEQMGLNDDKPPKSCLLSLKNNLEDFWVKLSVTCMCTHKYMFNLSHRLLVKVCFKLSCIMHNSVSLCKWCWLAQFTQFCC